MISLTTISLERHVAQAQDVIGILPITQKSQDYHAEKSKQRIEICLKHEQCCK